MLSQKYYLVDTFREKIFQKFLVISQLTKLNVDFNFCDTEIAFITLIHTYIQVNNNIQG